MSLNTSNNESLSVPSLRGLISLSFHPWLLSFPSRLCRAAGAAGIGLSGHVWRRRLRPTPLGGGTRPIDSRCAAATGEPPVRATGASLSSGPPSPLPSVRHRSQGHLHQIGTAREPPEPAPRRSCRSELETSQSYAFTGLKDLSK